MRKPNPATQKQAITLTPQPARSLVPPGNVHNSPAKKPSPQATAPVAKKEDRPAPVFDASPNMTKWAYDTGYENGLGIGFAHCIKFIVSLAEKNLVEYLKLPSRDALAQSGQLPSWWIATLLQAFNAQAPSIKLSAEISPPNPRSKALKVEPASEED